MRSLRARFILSHVLPILVVIPLVGVALGYLFETQVLLAQLSRELEQQATLVAAVASDNPQIWFDAQQAEAFTDLVGEQLTVKMMLLTPDGVLLASTDAEDVGRVGEELDIPGLREVVLTGQPVRIDYGEAPGTGAAEVLVPVVIGRQGATPDILGPQILGVIRLIDPLASVYERFPRTRTFIFAVVGAGLVVGVAMGLVLALSLERPLKRATQAIARMSGGEPLTTLPEQGPREIRLLLRAFNALSERLQTLERARRRLLANLVHELGRPLGALLSAAQALTGGADEDPALRRELVQGMDGEIRQMRHLLDDLTNLYDRTLGPLELDRQSVELRPWLVKTLAPWREAAQDKGLRWETDLPEALPEVTLDPQRMAQALENLISNAVKFTSSGGLVRVSAGVATGQALPSEETAAAAAAASGTTPDRPGGPWVWIRVTDTGPGIAPEERERIFAPFYRGSVGRRFPQGMGLGLGIAQELVAAHDGRIEVESAVGAGSVFTVWVPVERRGGGAEGQGIR